MLLLSRLLVLTTALVSAVQGYGDSGPCNGTCTNAHDPSVVRRSDGTYFRFSTNNRISIHSAPSIQGPWTYRGAALPKGSSINLPGNQDLWAPDVVPVGNSWYMTYSVSTFGSKNSAIGVASSPSLDAGTWTDLGSTGLSSSSNTPYNSIDSHLIYVGGAWQMSFGSFWSDIYTVGFTNPPTKVAGTPQQIAYNAADTAIEASFIHRHGGAYYLYTSHGACCNYSGSRPAPGKEYSIRVCRSASPTGGFVDKAGNACTRGGGTIVLESHGFVYGPGGQGVLDDPSGPILYYHYVDTRIGYSDADKRFGWNRIDYSSGWPVV